VRALFENNKGVRRFAPIFSTKSIAQLGQGTAIA
jgi:hypothetical protein